MAEPATPVLKLKRLQEEAQAILEDDPSVHLVPGAMPPAGRSFLQFWVSVGKSYGRNRCPSRASALAYTTLLAIVPLLALAVGISSSLLKKQGERPIEALIESAVAKVAPQLDLVSKNPNAEVKDGRREVVQSITQYIGRIQSGALNVGGVLGLVFVAVSLLATIETAFNDIWGVPRGRSWFSRVVHYWAAISLGPLFLLLAIGVTTGSHFALTRQWIESLPFVGVFLVSLFPFALLSLGFALFYQVMPNTKVDWRAALVGGAVGGCLWQLNNLVNVHYASKVFTYATIYGPMSLLPVFLLGLYFSWMIMLFGAQVACAFQSRRAYAMGLQSDAVHQSGREFAALRLMTALALSFHKGESPKAIREWAAALEIPETLALRLMQMLVKSGLVAEAAAANPTFVPARPLDQITVHHVLQSMRSGQGIAIATRSDPALAPVSKHVDAVRHAEARAAGQVTLLQIVQETGAA